VFNIFRISTITAIVQQHSSWFTFLHEYFLKYLFYAVIFALWVWWEEKFVSAKELNADVEVPEKKIIKNGD
jgi:hypothetical protein